jgi:hypothetical protein
LKFLIIFILPFFISCDEEEKDNSPSAVTKCKIGGVIYDNNNLASDTLNLSGLGLTNIGDCIGNLTSVSVMILANNLLQSVPDSISNLEYSLKTLDLSNNNINYAERYRVVSLLPETEIIWTEKQKIGSMLPNSKF